MKLIDLATERLMRRALAVLVFTSFAAVAQQKPAPAAKPPAPSQPMSMPALVPLDPTAETLLPLPSTSAPPLDLGLMLKDTSLCVFPFVKESAGASDKLYLESIQKTFFDVAKESPLLKDAVLLAQQSSKCEPHDASCISGVGKLAHCQNVLVGSSAAKGNGYVLSVRIFQVNKQSIMPGSEVEQVLETDRQSDVQAWAEGQACRALQVKCVGRLYVDADRKDMNIYVDNRLAPRTFKTPEQFGVQPGVHEVRISIGQRTSLAKKVAVRRGGFSETIYARQTDKGGLPLWLASEMNGGKPDASVEFHEGKWTRPVGYTVAGVGLVAAGVGVVEGLHGKSLRDQAQKNYAANGNTYLASDVSTLNSAHSAANLGNVLTIAGAVLVVAGAVLVFAF
jgi:hypothetical protein